MRTMPLKLTIPPRWNTFSYSSRMPVAPKSLSILKKPLKHSTLGRAPFKSTCTIRSRRCSIFSVLSGATVTSPATSLEKTKKRIFQTTNFVHIFEAVNYHTKKKRKTKQSDLHTDLVNKNTYFFIFPNSLINTRNL